MMSHAIIWDLETIPDLSAAARLFEIEGKDEQTVREKLGSGFPKLPLHKIACIGALVTRRGADAWHVDALGAPHIGDRSEADLIQSFVDKIAELRPQLVSFNGSGFDLPVLRYRALVNRVSAPGLQARAYFNRYSTDSLDLCDVLASFDARGKLKLDDLSKIIGLAGKPTGIDGSQVESMAREGRIAEVAVYCESDLVNTYRLWLAYELFTGALTKEGYDASEAALIDFANRQTKSKPHLSGFL